MKRHPQNGTSVLHVDGAAHTHSGVIVGQSDDGARVYVKSDSPHAPKQSSWDFNVNQAMVPTLIANAKMAAIHPHKVED